MLQFRIGEADAGGGAQIDVAQLAVIQQQRELLALGLFIARSLQASGADDRAGYCFVAELHLDARALQLIEHAAQRLPPADLERKLGQLLAQRIPRIVAQAGDLAAALLLNGERLQHVVHFAALKSSRADSPAPSVPRALEIADAVLVEDHLYGQAIRPASCRMRQSEERITRFHSLQRECHTLHPFIRPSL